MGGIDGLAAAMLCAFVFVSPIGLAGAAHAFTDPVALAAGVGVGISSSVIPYVCDQLAMARLPRAIYALFVALLPATATVIGVIVLHQLPSLIDAAGIGLVMVGVALHRPDATATPLKRTRAPERTDATPASRGPQEQTQRSSG
jgi:inner membrane transporter RhtA